MYKRTMTAITLGLTAALVALPAQAKTEALLIGTSRTADALVELRNTLDRLRHRRGPGRHRRCRP